MYQPIIPPSGQFVGQPTPSATPVAQSLVVASDMEDHGKVKKSV
jgi:hypothetical protein